MKKIIFSLIITGFALTGFAQENAQGQNQQPQATQQNQGNSIAMLYSNVYQRAIRYNDFPAAKNALYHLVNLFPQNDSLLYSLSVLYYQMQQYPSAALAASDVLTLNPNHIGAMEISAVSFSEIGAKEKAIEAYEKLFMNTDNFEVLYQLSFLQYDVKRYTEALANAKLLLNKKEASELTVTYNISETETKEYPIKAALYNLIGLIHKAQNNNTEAKAAFNEALKLAPDFSLAQENLKSVQ